MHISRNKSEEKRQRMLDTAGDLFLSGPYEAVSMDTIATHADVSKQTVYSHFGSKEELFAAVIESECAKHAITERLFDPSQPVEQVLTELAHHFTELQQSDRAVCLHRTCAANACHNSAVAELYWNAGPKRLQLLLHNYLQQQTEQGVLRIPNLKFASQQLLFMLKAEHQHRKVLGLAPRQSKQEIRQYTESCVALFLTAYRS